MPSSPAKSRTTPTARQPSGPLAHPPFPCPQCGSDQAIHPAGRSITGRPRYRCRPCHYVFEKPNPTPPAERLIPPVPCPKCGVSDAKLRSRGDAKPRYRCLGCGCQFTVPKVKKPEPLPPDMRQPCPHCASCDTTKLGRKRDKQQYRCKQCGRHFSRPIRRYLPSDVLDEIADQALRDASQLLTELTDAGLLTPLLRQAAATESMAELMRALLATLAGALYEARLRLSADRCLADVLRTAFLPLPAEPPDGVADGSSRSGLCAFIEQATQPIPDLTVTDYARVCRKSPALSPAIKKAIDNSDYCIK